MRRNVTDLCELNKVLNNSLNSSYIVSQVLFYVLYRSSCARRNRLFFADCRINIRKNTFIPRVESFANSHCEIDIFEHNKHVFKRNAITALS